MPHNWKEYAENTKNRTAHPLLKTSFAFLKLTPLSRPGRTLKAIDLGCGSGDDTLSLLESGCEVIAVDKEKQAIAILNERIHVLKRNTKSELTCKLINSRMKNVELGEQQDLITSNLALPFVSKASFPRVWSKIVQHLRFEGIFSGQFFGKRHKWANNGNMTFHNVKQFENLFKGLFNIIHSFEEKSEQDTVFQGKQFWHQYDMIAIRKPVSPEKPLVIWFDLNSELTKTNKQRLSKNKEHKSNSLR